MSFDFKGESYDFIMDGKSVKCGRHQRSGTRPEVAVIIEVETFGYITRDQKYMYLITRKNPRKSTVERRKISWVGELKHKLLLGWMQNYAQR